jgi:F-box domain
MFGFLSSLLSGQSIKGRINKGIVKVGILGDNGTGKRSLLGALSLDEVLSVKTWRIKQVDLAGVRVWHDEDRVTTYFENLIPSPFPTLALSQSYGVVLVFSLVDLLSFRSVLTVYLPQLLKCAQLGNRMPPVVLVGTHLDRRESILKSEKEKKEKEKGKSGGGAASSSSPDAERCLIGNALHDSDAVKDESDRRHFVRLPPDAVFAVLDRLQLADLMTLSLTCKLLKRYVDHGYNWRNRAEGIVTAAQVHGALRKRGWSDLIAHYAEICAVPGDEQDRRAKARRQAIGKLVFKVVQLSASTRRVLPEQFHAKEEKKKEEEKKEEERGREEKEKEEKKEEQEDDEKDDDDDDDDSISS